jgi:hypothetical protein
VFENYTACLETEEQRVELSLWDTSGKSVPPNAPSYHHWLAAVAAFLRGGGAGNPPLKIGACQESEGKNVKNSLVGALMILEDPGRQ